MTDKEKFCRLVKCYSSLVKRHDKVYDTLAGINIYVDDDFYNDLMCDLEDIIDSWFPNEEDVVERIFSIDYYGCTYIEKRDIEVCTVEELYDVLAEGQK
jgi:hypothetical protein